MRRTVAMALASGVFLWSQAPSVPSAVSMKQLMLDVIHPASNQLLLLSNRGGPRGDEEWAEARRSAATLAESVNILTARGRPAQQGDWAKDAQNLADAGGAAYKAAQAKDAKALAASMPAIDQSCTICHKQYRPNVYPREGGFR